MFLQTKIVLSRTIKHGLEMGFICGLVLLIVWAASVIGLVEPASVKDAVWPLLMAALGSMIPKYLRTSPQVPLDDYVNK